MPDFSPRVRRVLSSIRWVVVGLLLAAMLGPAAYSGLTNTQFISIEGASMAPTYEIGDLVVMAPPTPSDFTPGHVVTVRSSDGSLYTHRIVSVDDGQATLKGDGNSSPDPGSISSDDVVGDIVGHIGQPWAAPMTLLLQWPVRIFVALFIIGLVVLPLGTVQKPSGQDSVSGGGIGTLEDARGHIDDEGETSLCLDNFERITASPPPRHSLASPPDAPMPTEAEPQISAASPLGQDGHS